MVQAFKSRTVAITTTQLQLEDNACFGFKIRIITPIIVFYLTALFHRNKLHVSRTTDLICGMQVDIWFGSEPNTYNPCARI